MTSMSGADGWNKVGAPGSPGPTRAHRAGVREATTVHCGSEQSGSCSLLFPDLRRAHTTPIDVMITSAACSRFAC